MPGPITSCMHRPDRHFVHFLAFDAIEICHADERPFVGGPSEASWPGRCDLTKRSGFSHG